jgi:hypothetical protein
MKVLKRHADLPQVVGALRAAGRFASRLHGRQEQGHQDSDDGDDNEQFDERKSALSEWDHEYQLIAVYARSQSSVPIFNRATYRGSAPMSTQSTDPEKRSNDAALLEDFPSLPARPAPCSKYIDLMCRHSSPLNGTRPIERDSEETDGVLDTKSVRQQTYGNLGRARPWPSSMGRFFGVPMKRLKIGVI